MIALPSTALRWIRDGTPVHSFIAAGPGTYRLMAGLVHIIKPLLTLYTSV